MGKGNADRLNRAIVNKVESILENTEHITALNIFISGEVGAIPQIRYNITENIIPTEEVCQNADKD